MDGEIGRVVPHADGPVLDPGTTVPDLEQPPRADPEEGVAPEALPSLDGFEEERRRRPVVEPQEGADRGLEVGRARGAQEHGVGRGRLAFRLGQAERVRAAVHRRHSPSVAAPGTSPPGNQERPSSSRDERSCLPRCHPHSAIAALVTDGPLVVSCRSALPSIAGALRRSLLCVPDGHPPAFAVRSGGSRVHSPPPSSRFPPATGSLPSTLDGYSSRSSPIFGSDAESRRRARGASSGGRSLDAGAPRYRGRGCRLRRSAWPRWTPFRHRRSPSSGA